MRESQYPTKEIKFLEDGFRAGFDIGYDGPLNRQSSADNIPFSVGDKVELWNKLMKEVKLKRVAGPFDSIPFDNYIQSPIGLMPKSGSDQARLIFHLSYDFKDGLRSVNFHTPKKRCSVHYRDLDCAVETYIQLAKEIIFGESDKCDDVIDCAHRSNEIKTKESQYLSRPQLQDLWRDKFDNHNK